MPNSLFSSSISIKSAILYVKYVQILNVAKRSRCPTIRTSPPRFLPSSWSERILGTEISWPILCFPRFSVRFRAVKTQKTRKWLKSDRLAADGTNRVLLDAGNPKNRWEIAWEYFTEHGVASAGLYLVLFIIFSWNFVRILRTKYTPWDAVGK